MTDDNYAIASSLADAVPDEETAMYLYNRLAERFGWSGTFFNREDLKNKLDLDDCDDVPDPVWDTIRLSHEWTDGLPEVMSYSASEALYDVLDRMRRDGRIPKEL